jgi:hypothetical protein
LFKHDCCLTRDLHADDARIQYRFDTSIRRLNLDTAATRSEADADESVNALWPWK